MGNYADKMNRSESSASPESPSLTETTPQAKGKQFYARVATSRTEDGHPSVLRHPPRMHMCLRIDGIFFAFNRSFVRDSPPDIRNKTIQSLTMLREGLQKYPKGKLAIFGHADYVGQVPYNKKLSERRAEAIYALLTLDASIWQRLYSEELWWKDTSISSVLKNDKSEIEAYMQNFLKAAGLSKADKKTDFCPKHPFIGCSEYNPLDVFNPSELKAHQKDHTKRDKDNERNRRVVVYIFDEDYLPSFPCMHSSESSAVDAVKNCDIPPLWKQNKEYKRQVSHTFACKFYDSQIALDCSIEHPELVPIPLIQNWIVEITGFQIMYDSKLQNFVDEGLFKKGYYLYEQDSVNIQFRVVIEFTVTKNRSADPWSYKEGKIKDAQAYIDDNIKSVNDPGRNFPRSDIQAIDFDDPDCATSLVGKSVWGEIVDVKDVERLYGPSAGLPSGKVPKTTDLQFRRMVKLGNTYYGLIKGQSTLGFEKVPHVSLRMPSFSTPITLRFKTGNTLTISERAEDTLLADDLKSQWIPLREKEGTRQFEHVREELLDTPVYPFPYMIVYYTHLVKGPF